MLSVYVIGCGGIGGFVVDSLLMQLCSISLDAIEQSGTSIQPWLKGAGNKALPCVADRVVLVDGDTFNPRNAIRQGAGAGSKLVQRMHTMKHDMIKVAFLQSLQLSGFNAYVNPENVEKIIPRIAAENAENRDMAAYANARVAIPGMPVVFLCVDNLKTRYELSKYMEKFDDCLVVNGGNSKETGLYVITPLRREPHSKESELLGSLNSNAWQSAAEPCVRQNAGAGKVHRLSRKGVPDKRRGSTPTWEQVDDIVSALEETKGVVRDDILKPAFH